VKHRSISSSIFRGGPPISSAGRSSSGNIPATSIVNRGDSGYGVDMTAVTFDVPELVAEVAGDSAGYSALQAALTEAAIAHVRENHPEQLADIASRIVAELDRDLITGFHAR